MRKHTAAVAAACTGVLAATIAAGATRVAHAAECLVEPAGPTPAGHHWYYRLDHANGRKCWYLKNVGAAAEKAAAAKTQPSAGRTDDATSSLGTRRPAREREALFEEFLRWQQRQESRR